MIVPVGHDSGGLARRPVVTWAIAAACVAAFLATSGLRDPVMADVDDALERAFDHWESHPYLEPPGRLVDVYGDLGEAARERFHASWREDGAPPVAPARLADEQAELDGLVARAEARLRDHTWFRYGLVPAAPRVEGLFGHLFLHGGWGHLLGNLVFLLLAAPLLEDRWGRGLFALFYVAAGLAGAALFVARYPHFDAPLIGASGAIAGVLGAFLVRFGRANLRFVYWLGFFFGRFSAPAWLLLPLWFAHELASAQLVEAAGVEGGIAYWAHVGGFAFGVLVAFAVRAMGLEPPEAAVGDERPLEAPTGDEAGGREPLPAHARARAPARAAADVAARLREGDRDAALAAWEALCRAEARPACEPETALRLAGWLRAKGRTGPALQALWAALAAGDAQVALRVARAAKGFDPVVTLRAAGRALASPELAAAERPRLEALAAEAEREARARGVIVVPDGAPVDARRTGRASASPDPAEWLASPELAPPGWASDDPPDRSAFDDPRALDLLPEEDEAAAKEMLPAPPPPPVRHVTEAQPLRLEEGFLWLDVAGRGRSRLALGRISGVALAGVRGLGRPRTPDEGPRAVVLLDLVVDARRAGAPRHVLRLRSDGFDPRRLAAPDAPPLEALRRFAAELVARSRATPLTEAAAGPSAALRLFPDVAAYEAEVLG